MAFQAIVQHQQLRDQVTQLQTAVQEVSRREFLTRKVLLAILLQHGEQAITRRAFQEVCNDDQYAFETTARGGEDVMIVRLHPTETDDPLSDGQPAELPEIEPVPEPDPVEIPTEAAMDPA